jgi:DNA invertase Pin-like site-specific DNA recombinase
MIQGTGPASIYVRISEDRDGEGQGVDRQEKDCRELAARQGWEVAKVYSDNNLSASKKGVVRPQYQQLLKDIQAGTVRRLIVDKPDRLYRKTKELDHLIDVIEGVGHPVEIAVVKQSNGLDLSTTNGRMVARILGATAQAEAETIRDRIKRKMDDKISKGEWKGGPRPFGFESVDKRLRQKPGEIKLLRKAKDDLIAGRKSIHVICKEWAAAGVRSGRSAVVAETTLVKMLTSSRMVGEYEGGVKGDWEKVFEPHELETLRAILKTKSYGKRREGGVYLLTGEILKCAECHGPLYGTPTYGGKWVGGTKTTGGTFQKVTTPYYTCRDTIAFKGCGHVAMRVSDLDDEVMRQIADFLEPFFYSETEFLSMHFSESPGLAAASAELAKVHAVEARADEQYREGDITKAEYREAKHKLEPRLKAAAAAVEAAQGQIAGLHELATLPADEIITRWREMDRDERRHIVLALVAEVRVKPHHGGERSMRSKPDPNRVEVVFRPELLAE